MRVRTSSPLSAAKVTTNVTGRAGQFCAEVLVEAAEAGQRHQSEQYSEIHHFHPCKTKAAFRFCPHIVSLASKALIRAHIREH